MKDIIKVMTENELFKNISEEEIEVILNNMNYVVKSYNKGQIIAQEDDHCDSLALVIDGKVELHRIYPSGNFIVLSTIVRGNVFGEALVVSKNQMYPATVIAVEESKIFFINKDDVLSLCSNNNIVLENFISLLSSKVFILNSKIKSISFRTVKQRVINYILEEMKVQKSTKITLSSSKEAIASRLGIPRPSLSRELINLRDDGWISFDRKVIEILNEEELEGELFN